MGTQAKMDPCSAEAKGKNLHRQRDTQSIAAAFLTSYETNAGATLNIWVILEHLAEAPPFCCGVVHNLSIRDAH